MWNTFKWQKLDWETWSRASLHVPSGASPPAWRTARPLKLWSKQRLALCQSNLMPSIYIPIEVRFRRKYKSWHVRRKRILPFPDPSKAPLLEHCHGNVRRCCGCGGLLKSYDNSRIITSTRRRKNQLSPIIQVNRITKQGSTLFYKGRPRNHHRW